MTSVLIVDDHQYTSKIENHLMPLAEVVDDNRMVCVNKNEDVDNINYLTVPTFGSRLIAVFLLLPYAIIQGFRHDYDAVVAISLVPYGIYALIIKFLTRTPAHLVIIGGDLDVHAVSWYGKLPQQLFKQFDTLSVLGSEHKCQLAEMGVPPRDIFILSNSVDIERFKPKDCSEEYDFIWVGKFQEIKDPLLLIKALKEYKEKEGDDFKAVMVGDGELRPQVESQVENSGLEKQVDFPGWVSDPSTYYNKSKIYIMTSNREAMGLTLIEALCTGLPSIAPNIGNISDVITDRDNGFIIDRMNETEISNRLSMLMENNELYKKMSESALDARSEFSFENAQEDWNEIIQKTVHSTSEGMGQ